MRNPSGRVRPANELVAASLRFRTDAFGTVDGKRQPAIRYPMTLSDAPEFVFVVLGTRGDVLPVLAIAQEMVGRGHSCRVLANDSFESDAASSGVPFVAVAPQQKNNLTTIENNFSKHLFRSYEPIYEFFRRELRHTSNLIVVNLRPQCASAVLADLYGLPTCRLYLAPYSLHSVAVPPQPYARLHANGLRHIATKYTLPRMYASWDTFPFLLDHINRYRVLWGLPPVSAASQSDRDVRQHQALFPEWYCAPAPDWPRGIVLPGFVLPSSGDPLPREFTSFVETQGKPLVFTPGTGVVDVGHFLRCAAECCLRLDLPGVFLSPNIAAVHGARARRVKHFNYLDLDLVLKHALLLVHHGGIGTTARALQAGIPQIISPQAYDQPDNADRISHLGVGKVIERSDLTGALLAAEARRLLDDPGAARHLCEVKRKVGECNAAGAAADHLERVFVDQARKEPRGRSAPTERERGRELGPPPQLASAVSRTTETPAGLAASRPL